MASRIAWLDASAEEQRRVREIVQLFSQRDTQDELGGRRIVVALSDALFPGTSVLHARARYVLFIPWLAQLAASKRDPVGWFEWLERQLIRSFLDDGTVEAENRLTGLIGRLAGPSVRQLPSNAYWTSLVGWGILLVPGTVADTLSRMRQAGATNGERDADELVARAAAVWHHGVGAPPPGFPSETIAGGFALTAAEAEWLRERWLATTSGSMLAHLASNGEPLTDEWAPWHEPACRAAPTAAVEVLDDAERFSLASDGARLLYSYMLSDRYDRAGFTDIDVDLDAARQRLTSWADEVRAAASLFDGWEPAAFWAFVRGRNARIDHITRQFFDVWFDRVRRGDVADVASDTALCDAVEGRERFLKHGQARLTNRKMLAAFPGGAPGRTTYRWPAVTRLLHDMHEGLARDAGS